MASIVDSVKNISLNGSSDAANGGEVVNVRSICCVGAGYVGTFIPSSHRLRCPARSPTGL